MRKLLYFLFAISLFHNFAISQWVQQNGGTTVTLYSVQFVNENTGWITGTASKILKTTNGGNNWFQQISPVAGRELNGIQMIDANTGYIAGWNNTFLKTTNGGENWLQLPGPSLARGSLNALSFINLNTGWACGFLGIIWRTTNGGLNWDSLSTGNTGPLRDIQFLNNQTGWVVGDGGYLRKTTNAGNSWFFQFFATTADFWYNSLQFISLNNGWVVGRNNSIYRTTNSGINWDTISITPGICLRFVNSMTGWTGGSTGNLYKTTNGGLNFYLQIIPVTGGFFTDIDFINDSIGWAIDVYAILHTTNGGTYVGINPISNNTPDSYNLFQNYPNPFNSETVIEFEIKKDGFAKIEIFNSLGQIIDTPVNQNANAGIYKFQWKAINFPSGLYFYRLTVSDFTETRKMILNK